MDLLTMFKVFIGTLIGCVVGYFIREREYKRENKHIKIYSGNEIEQLEEIIIHT